MTRNIDPSVLLARLSRSPWRLLTLALIFGCAVATRIEYSRSFGFGHDDVVSVVVAQGNVSRYGQERDTLIGTWVRASEWKRYFADTNDASLSTIASELSKSDIHPPLYFWMLRRWIELFGPNDAVLLNVLISLITTTALFGLSQLLLKDKTAAVLAVSIWLLTPPAIRTSLAIRQYELLALVAVLIAYQTARIARGKNDALNVTAFAALALAAMLTQYLAAIVILTALVLMIIKRVPLSRILFSLIVAAALFVVIHPGFYLQLGSYERDVGLAARSMPAATTLLNFYGWRASWTTPTIAFSATTAASGLFCLAIFWVVRRKKLFLPVAFFAFPAGVALAAYLMALTPSNSFGDRHISFAWPFAAILHAALIQSYLPRYTVAAVAVLAIVVAPSEVWFAHKRTPSTFAQVVGAAQQIVINNTGRGILPRYLLSASDNAVVYAAHDLAKDTDWISALQPGAVIILNPQYLDANSVDLIELVLRKQTSASIIFKEWTTTVYRVR